MTIYEGGHIIPNKVKTINLTEGEKNALEGVLRQSTVEVRAYIRAKILLLLLLSVYSNNIIVFSLLAWNDVIILHKWRERQRISETYASKASGYPFGHPDALVGGTPSPGLVVLAPSRTRLAAWLHASHDQQEESNAA